MATAFCVVTRDLNRYLCEQDIAEARDELITEWANEVETWCCELHEDAVEALFSSCAYMMVEQLIETGNHCKAKQYVADFVERYVNDALWEKEKAAEELADRERITLALEPLMLSY